MVTDYKFNAKELDNETGMYYYGARYYTPELSVWLSVDPMSDERPNLSPYNYCRNNPIRFIDPTGMLDWEPEVDGLGNVSYKAEKGDTKETFKSQYGLSESQATRIFRNSGIDEANVEVGTTVSGEAARAITGSDILKLNWNSPQATDQRKVDQIMFGIKKSQIEGKEILDLKNFNNNMYNRGRNFSSGNNLTIKVRDGRIPINNFSIVTDSYTTMMSYPQPPYGDRYSMYNFRTQTKGTLNTLMITIPRNNENRFNDYYYSPGKPP